MRNGKWWLAASFALAASAALADPGAPAAAASSPAPSPELAAKGASLYRHNCVHCHGVNMVSPGTGAFDLRQFPHDDKARFVNSVTNGKGGMPSWKGTLQPADIDALWAYVLTGGGQ
jgi:mono/diheme cytochrome c family protein